VVALALLAGPACGPPGLIDEPLPAPARRFLVGNESRHDLFATTLAGRRGALVCVGGDHCYTLAALADAERLYIIDHDPRVIALHAELGARIAAAADPTELLAGLSRPPTGELAGSWTAVTDHLRRVATRRRSWLADPGLHARVHRLSTNSAIEAVVGDVAGDRTMASIARSAQAQGLPITAVYLSNVEETLPDRHALRANLAALPRSPDAVLLRTLFREDWPAADGLWSYQAHVLADVLNSDAPTLAAVIAEAEQRGALRIDSAVRGFSTIDAGPS
jgi:hypothetical protein